MRTASSTHDRRWLAAGLLLLACGGSNSPPPGSSITVTGRLVDGFGKPLEGRTVLVGPVSTHSDANGNFSASSVPTPYDVILLETSPTRRVTVFAQLTRSDPQLVGLSDAPMERGTLGGQLLGGDPLPTPPGTRTGVCFSSPEGGGIGVVTSNPYAFQVLWYGPTSTTGNVRALQWTVDANGTVTGYRSHGLRTGVTLTADGTTSGVDVTLTPTATPGTVSGTLTIPDGYSLDWRNVEVAFAQGNVVPSLFPVSGDTVDSPSFSFPVPSGIGASANIWARASSGAVQTEAHLIGLPPGSTAAALTLPAAALIISPPDGSTGIDTTTEFSWTPVANALYSVALYGKTTYFILTGRTSTRIPDLTAQGFGLPPGYPYDWELHAGGPYASIDEYAAPREVSFGRSGFSTWTSANFTTR